MNSSAVNLPCADNSRSCFIDLPVASWMASPNIGNLLIITFKSSALALPPASIFANISDASANCSLVICIVDPNAIKELVHDLVSSTLECTW